MLSCQDILCQAKGRLSDAGVENPRSDALLLLCSVCGISREELLRQPDLPISSQNVLAFENAIVRRTGREPVSRILGRREFWGLDFSISPDVLDPRPDSEMLIEAALSATIELVQPRVLDLGTGSGCLLLAYLSERSDAKGLGIDLCPDAIAVANQNAATLGLSSQVEFAVGDWTAGLDMSFDLVLCNPPYVAEVELRSLQPEVRNFDPCLSLVAGADGLSAFQLILSQLENKLNVSTQVFFECGSTQALQVRTMLENSGFLQIKIKKDLAGHDRVVSGRFGPAAKKV